MLQTATSDLLVALCLLVGAIEAGAAPPELSARVTAPRPAACTEYRFLFSRLYRAELWSDATALPGEQFGLSLSYRRDFTGEALVQTSVDEMARMSQRPQESFAAARAQLERALRDVGPGDRFTAWREAPDQVRFFFNGSAVGTLTRDADLFLEIWLGPGSRFQARRRDLLSGPCDD